MKRQGLFLFLAVPSQAPKYDGANIETKYDNYMLDRFIEKYKDRRRDKEQIVYKLSYAGKFIIIKGKTLCGSLIIINNVFKQYDPANTKRFEGHLYKHLFDHFLETQGTGRFRIKTLARVNVRTSLYQVLKREQMELDKNRYNPNCLNNAVEAFIPLYNEDTGMYGWIDKTTVMNFHRWLNSKEHKAYKKRYGKAA